MSEPLPFDPIAEAGRQWRAHFGPGPDAPMEAVTSIMRVQQLLLARCNAALEPFGLTFARYEALVLLAFSRSGRLPLGKMGARLQVHPTSVTNAIDRLEAQGLVRRIADPNDRRSTLAEITPAGREAVERATGAVAGGQFGLAMLAEADLRELSQILRHVRREAGDFETS